jgi:uncharacterized protein YndB with AHSA1/START domain
MSTRPQEITLTCTILTSPSQVYDAFTRPESWREWCCEKAETDPRVGGKLHIYTEGYNAYGEFTLLEQDQIIVFTWDGDGEPPTLIHISLNKQGDSTNMTFKVTGLCSKQDWAGFADFLERTWGRALNNLKTVLETKPDT